MQQKLIMTLDISPDREQEYFEFVVREFIPQVQSLGLELSDAWATVFGNQPQIMVGAVLPSPDIADDILDSEEWIILHNKLQDFVLNYNQKIVPYKSSFQF